ncbi:NAD-dependent epimerase/dehydratase family protein [Dactylosporangium sp. NPDC051541]|uniref:NAD-dependent epimerase/dehydratase family protein n=1 Tax=Dactylosporangium sp. NPDC051541 TaxID=3363977 RepID=UPI0037AB389D
MTGASGAIGHMLRERLQHHDLRLTDVEAEAGVAALDVTDGAAVARMCAGVDAIVHLGGIASEGPFEDVLAVNVRGTERVLQAAHEMNVPRVVLASSNHAVGLHVRGDDMHGGDMHGRGGGMHARGGGMHARGGDMHARGDHMRGGDVRVQTDGVRGGDMLADDIAPRPDSYYGWSKAAMEALGRLYHDRYGLHVVCLRIGTCTERPQHARDLATWLSPDDAGRLVDAALHATGFRLVWGVSANTRRWWSDAGGRAIGYEPKDDAERFKDDVEPPKPEDRLVGGDMATRPLGV